MRRSRIVVVGTIVAAGVLLAGCGSSDSGKDTKSSSTTVAKPQVTEKMTIAKIAGLDSQFSLFLDLVKTAGLTDTLTEDGPFTVFAPNSASLLKLGKSKIEDLKSDKSALKELLENHLAKGEITLADLAALNGKTLRAVSGAELPIKVEANTVTVGGAKVLKSDIAAENGMIFVIDGLVEPQK